MKNINWGLLLGITFMFLFTGYFSGLTLGAEDAVSGPVTIFIIMLIPFIAGIFAGKKIAQKPSDGNH